MTTERLLPAIFIAALFVAPALVDAPSGLAEEPPFEQPETDEGAAAEPVELKEASTEEAKKLLDALKKVAKKKNATLVTPALDAMAGLKHQSWEKTLLKLLRHKSSLVALKTAGMWTGRVRDKNVRKLWKASWGDKINDKRFVVKTKVLRALGLFGHVLDKKQYKDVERDWRWMVGNPNEKYADALIDICFYFEKTKDKRHCRKMAEELDEPLATNPNSPSNPPADWWERRWKMWKPMKVAAVEALKAITGQEFDKTEQARKWFEANEKEFGFKW